MAADREGKEKEFEVKEQRFKGITKYSKKVNDKGNNGEEIIKKKGKKKGNLLALLCPLFSFSSLSVAGN